MGAMGVDEYRAKWFGETLEQARKNAASAEQRDGVMSWQRRESGPDVQRMGPQAEKIWREAERRYLDGQDADPPD